MNYIKPKSNLLPQFLGCALMLFGYFFAYTNVFATSLSLTGKAKVQNSTSSYLNFSANSANVGVDSVTGNFSGYGYMEDLGWVAFGTVDNSLGPVNLNISTGVVSGKAKVLSTGDYLDFSGYNSNVKATIPNGVFSGYVFSESAGWIDFADTGVFVDGSFDNAPPSGGSISYTDGYQTVNSVALTVADGTDSSSGLNTSSRITQRKSATFADGTCGTFSSFSVITPTGTYPDLMDSTVLTGNCYQYKYLISDNASNQATYISSNVVKVDTDAPSIPGTPSTTNPTNLTSQTWTFTAATDVVSGATSEVNTSVTGSVATGGVTCV